MNTMPRILGIAFIFLLPSCHDKKTTDLAQSADHSVPILKKEIVGVAEIQPVLKVISLYPQTGGIIKAIYHDINDNVKKGEVILELIGDVEQAQLDQAQSKLATQRAVINSSKAQLASLQVRSDNSKLNFTRNQNLILSGAVTQQSLDDSRFAYESSVKDVEASQASEKQQESRLSELQADIYYYQQLINQKKLRAPFNGKVLSMDMIIGNFVNTNQSVGDFAPEGPLMAITEVDELYANRVKDGMGAYIRPQGKTDTLAKGKIFLTSPYLRKKTLFSDNAANMEDRRVREVRVLLDQGAHVLIGSRVECVITLKE
jgi:HlyD family secretion protein